MFGNAYWATKTPLYSIPNLHHFAQCIHPGNKHNDEQKILEPSRGGQNCSKSIVEDEVFIQPAEFNIDLNIRLWPNALKVLHLCRRKGLKQTTEESVIAFPSWPPPPTVTPNNWEKKRSAFFYFYIIQQTVRHILVLFSMFYAQTKE